MTFKPTGPGRHDPWRAPSPHERRWVYVGAFRTETGDVWYRARCSICVPRWSGPWRRIMDLIIGGRGGDGATLEAELHDLVLFDVFRHADLLHGGKIEP